MRQIDADELKESFIQVLENIKSNPRMTGQEMHIITAIHTVGQMIDNAPTIEAEPVRSGEWIEYPIADGMNQCSNCGVLRFGESNYCPNCGAKMRKSK